MGTGRKKIQQQSKEITFQKFGEAKSIINTERRPEKRIHRKEKNKAKPFTSEDWQRNMGRHP